MEGMVTTTNAGGSMKAAKLPKNAFVMRGLTFRRQSDLQLTWHASTRYGRVEIVNTPLGEWFVGFVRHGAYVTHNVNRNMRKAFDRMQLMLVEMSKLEAP